MRKIDIPPRGSSRDEVLSKLESMKSDDTNWADGRMFSLIYNAGEEVREVAREAFNLYFMENGLSPFAFPSLRKLEVEVSASQLDDLGMAIDFKHIKQAARELGGELDHRYLNEIPPFDKINPTAENIAAYLYKGIGDKVNNEHIQVCAVTLWETERACVRYTEE